MIAAGITIRGTGANTPAGHRARALAADATAARRVGCDEIAETCSNRGAAKGGRSLASLRLWDTAPRGFARGLPGEAWPLVLAAQQTRPAPCASWGRIPS